MKVYLVSQGIYSDFVIKAVFSNRETADKYAAVIGERDYGNVLEYELDDPSWAEWVNEPVYTVEINESGNEISRWDYADLHKKNERAEREYGFKKDYMAPKYPITFEGVSYISFDHALKLASEERQKWLVEMAAEVSRVDKLIADADAGQYQSEFKPKE